MMVSSPALSPLSLPSTVPPLNDANMDALPLELKQRICSFLKPKDLKPLRLTSRIFATAAERYFIDRFILFNHPDSIAALGEIVAHEVFSRYITTLVCDTSLLDVQKVYANYQDCRPASPPPSWDDYRPKTLVLDDTESYGSMTKRVMQSAHEEYQTACRNWAARERTYQAHRDWYHAMADDQKHNAHCLKLAATLRKAFERCPRLRNLILSARHPRAVRKRRFNMLGHEDADAEDFSRWSRYLTGNRSLLSQLSSLTLINTGIERHIRNAPSLTLTNLRHLRMNHEFHNGSSYGNLTYLAFMLRSAKSLETLSLSLPEHYITNVVQSLRSDCLRTCLLRFDFVRADALVEFLLYHAASLERLGLSHGFTGTDWLSIFGRITGNLPVLRRLQLEGLDGPQGYMTLESAKEAERFVAIGGPVPVLQYEDTSSIQCYSGPNRGTYIGGPEESDHSSGLWQDYEHIANEDWD